MASEAETAVDIIQVFDVVARVASLVAAHRADNGALATRGAPRENMAVISSALSLMSDIPPSSKKMGTTNYCNNRDPVRAMERRNNIAKIFYSCKWRL